MPNENTSRDKSKGSKINWSFISNPIQERYLLQSLHSFNSLGNRCVNFRFRNLGNVTNLGSFLAGVSTFLALIEDKVVPKVLMISSILSILDGSKSWDLMVSKVLTILCMELSSLFKFP